MADTHVYLHANLALGAGARGTITFGPTDGLRYTVRNWTWVSSGAWSLLDIRDAAGNHYVADQSGAGIPSTAFTRTDNSVEKMMSFDPSIVLEAGGFLYCDVIDTSGAPNTIALILSAMKSA